MKDTFYFPHDYNARSDPKLQEVLIDLGLEGIGLYWCIIEQMYEQGGSLPLRHCKSIAFAYHVQLEVVHRLIENYGLFSHDDEEMWSNSAMQRLGKREEISNKRKRAARSRWTKKSDCQEEATSYSAPDNANAMQMQCKCNANKGKEKKGKEKKGNNNISTNVDTSTCVDAHSNVATNYSRLLSMWREHCPSFPQPRSLSDDDKRKIKQRIGEMAEGKDTELAYQRLQGIFQSVNASDFCRDGKWCTFRWIFANATNWRKVEEGNYSNNNTATNSSGTKKANEEWT